MSHNIAHLLLEMLSIIKSDIHRNSVSGLRYECDVVIRCLWFVANIKFVAQCFESNLTMALLCTFKRFAETPIKVLHTCTKLKPGRLGI